MPPQRPDVNADASEASEALMKIAIGEASVGNYDSAIDDDRRALQLRPQAASALRHLALVLSWDHQYGPSVRIYQALIKKSPNDRFLLERLSQVYSWAGQLKNALQAEGRLESLDPSNRAYALTAARLNLTVGDSRAAEKILRPLLAAQPADPDALLLDAKVKQKQGRLGQSLAAYDSVLARDFQNTSALYGAAQINYFLGRPDRAYPLAARLVRESSADIDALLLLARIDRALGKHKAALAMVTRANTLNPGNNEVHILGEQIRSDSSITIHTSASYARELGITSFGQSNEDLNSYGGSIRIGFRALPKSQSYVVLSASPSDSPSGFQRGAVAPAEVLYGQTTEVSRRFTARGGIGEARTGTGLNYIGYDVPRSPQFIPVGFAGFSFFPAERFHIDFAISRETIPDTPVSVRLGATRLRATTGMGYSFDSRTRLSASVYRERDSARDYSEFWRSLHDTSNGASLEFSRDVIRTERLTLSMGYSGLAFGYVSGAYGSNYLGFFNPRLYQRHFATSSLHRTVWGPLEFTLTGDFGIQQADRGQPFTQAYQFGPAVTWRLGHRHSITAGYLHYDSAQALGKIKGNALTLSSDWRF